MHHGVRRTLILTTLTVAGVALLGWDTADAGVPVVVSVVEARAADSANDPLLLVFGDALVATSRKFPVTFELVDVASNATQQLSIMTSADSVAVLRLPSNVQRSGLALRVRYGRLGSSTPNFPLSLKLGSPPEATVGADSLAPGAVSSQALAAGAVNSQALAAGSVNSSALASGAVGSQALATGAVGSQALAVGAVGSQALAAGAVNTAAIASGAVDARTLATGAVTPPALSVELRTDLDDAATLGGRTSAYFLDAANLGGSLHADRFSAFDDLGLENRIGPAPNQVSRGDHEHDARYVQPALLAAQGVLNSAANPVDWTKLKSVPAPFADGIDNDTTYTNGTGLSLTGSSFAVNFAGSGSSTAAARSDHDHDAAYVNVSGDTMTGTLAHSVSGATQGITVVGAANRLVEITNSGVNANGLFVSSTGTGGSGVFSQSSQFTGYGVNGTNTAGGIGVLGSANFSGVGVDGVAFATGIGVRATNTGTGSALIAQNNSSSAPTFVVTNSSSSAAVVATSNGTSNSGSTMYAEQLGIADVLHLRHSGGSGNICRFENGQTNVARIDKSGRGYFNGGTQTSGADFAESVEVKGPARDLAPGDVIVIDHEGVRRFAKSTAANSTAVAGIYSTRPGVLARPGDVAGDSSEWQEREIPLAITGIVPCRVCDEGGPIRAGDLLVSSSIPGHAMKAPANPAAGTVVAKALGALATGRGLVEVLVTAR